MIHDWVIKDSVKLVSCDQAEAAAGHWIWTEAGQLVWSEGCQKCVQSHKFNTPVHMHFCLVSIAIDSISYHYHCHVVRTTQRIRTLSLVFGRINLTEERQNLPPWT